MASMHEGPVGRSLEVYAPGRDEAIEEARAIFGTPAARALFSEQVEAGKWEVVLEVEPSKGEAAPEPVPDFITELDLLGKRFGVPTYAKVLTHTGGAKLSSISRTLSGLTAEERAGLIGVEVHIDPKAGK